jgi:hypothetical protein
MSAITWTTETSASPLISSRDLKIFAGRVGFGLGLVAATSTALTGTLLVVLMATSIIQF